MPTTQKLSTPVEIDTHLAELFHEANVLEQAVASRLFTVLSMAGAKYYYRGRRRVTDMTRDEAVAILETKPRDKRNLTHGRTNGEALDQLHAAEAALSAKEEEIREAQDLYTGWSRFFLVTSSNGHIHSSKHCSTCRPTTQYGWLPDMSDKSMAEAIAFFGPAAECLCSVCFPDAPTKDRNLTQKEIDALLAGKTPEPVEEKVYCPGSGKQAVGRRPGGRYGNCPHCGYNGAVTQYGQMRKHKEQQK